MIFQPTLLFLFLFFFKVLILIHWEYSVKLMHLNLNKSESVTHSIYLNLLRMINVRLWASISSIMLVRVHFQPSIQSLQCRFSLALQTSLTILAWYEALSLLQSETNFVVIPRLDLALKLFHFWTGFNLYFSVLVIINCWSRVSFTDISKLIFKISKWKWKYISFSSDSL